MTFEIIPTGHALGAEIRGVDLAGNLGDADFGAIRAAWPEHLVLLYRGHHLEPCALAPVPRRLNPGYRTDLGTAAWAPAESCWRRSTRLVSPGAMRTRTGTAKGLAAAPANRSNCSSW